MAVDLSDFADVLRREVSGPGVDTPLTDDQLVGYMADAVWEARLDGFLTGYSADPDGIVTPEDPGTPDITRDLIALVVVYAGVRILRNQILNTNTAFKAKAGPVEFETENSANVLVELLRQLKGVKDRLLAIQGDFGMTTVQLVDGYTVRALGYTDLAGLLGEVNTLALGSGVGVV